MQNQQPQAQIPSHYTQVQNPTQPLPSDVVDKLINRDIRAALFSFLCNSEEVITTKPIYEDVTRTKLDDNGAPLVDKKTGKLVKEKVSVKIGSEKHRKLKPIYESSAKINKFVNDAAAIELVGLIELSCNSTTRTSYHKDRDLTEAGKEIAQAISNQIIIRYRDYGFSLSTSRSISLFQGLAMIISSTISTSEGGAMLQVVQNTHKFNPSLDTQMQEDQGLMNKLRKLL